MIDVEVMRLNDMGLNDLRELWKEYFEEDCLSLNRKYYVYRLAYRMQESVYGGLPRSLKKELLETKLVDTKKRPYSAIPIPGTKIVRFYRGKEYACRVLRNGFEYNGRFYKTLSAVAKEITNLKISGTFFFNLDKGGSKKDE